MVALPKDKSNILRHLSLRDIGDPSLVMCAVYVLFLIRSRLAYERKPICICLCHPQH